MVGRRRRLRRAPVILQYHRIASAAADPYRRTVSPMWFREHMTALRASRRPLVHLSELARRHTAGDVPTGAVAVTFDDGYADHLHEAAPVLAELDIPATMLVTTGTLGTAGMWWDTLADLVLTDHPAPPAVEVSVGQQHYVVDLGDGVAPDQFPEWDLTIREAPTRRHAALRDLWWLLLSASATERTGVLEQLGRVLTPRPDAGRRMLTADEVATLERTAPIEVGSHTVTHTSLTRRTHADRPAELVDARDRLEEIVGHRVSSVAYPHGNVDADVADAARRAGYDHGVTTGARPVDGDDDVMRLPRVPAPDAPASTLLHTLRW